MNRESACLYLGTPTPLRLWTGAGDLALAAGGPDATGGLYRGSVAITLPPITLYCDGGADRAAVTLSGTDESALGLATTNAAAAKGALFGIAIVAFNAAWQIVGAPDWLAIWTVDTIETAAPIAREGEPRRRAVTLGLTAGDARRSRPRAAYWSDSDQRARSPGDRFFDLLPAMPTAEKIWPRF